VAVVDVGGGNDVRYCWWLHFFSKEAMTAFDNGNGNVDKGKGGRGWGDEGVPVA
jgi:hypothetical protein